MEFHVNHRQESMNPSEEAEHESTYIRVRRFYECVFCKRGFDTAQALGGHMNIHRKDKARNKPTSTPSKQEEDYTDPRLYRQIPVSINDHKYSTYFTGTSTVPLYEHHPPPPPQQRYSTNDFDRDRCQRTNRSINPGDWRVLGLDDFPPVIMGGLETNHEEELDLELRLGYES